MTAKRFVDTNIILYATGSGPTDEAKHRISYRDAAIVTAAQAVGCHTLYSEDLGHGKLYGTIRVINPFVEGS